MGLLLDICKKMAILKEIFRKEMLFERLKLEQKTKKKSLF